MREVERKIGLDRYVLNFIPSSESEPSINIYDEKGPLEQRPDAEIRKFFLDMYDPDEVDRYTMKSDV